MSDIMRIFLIFCCMYLSFRLGEERAGRKAYEALMEGIRDAIKEIDDYTKSKREAPGPNETLCTDTEDSQI